MPSIRRSIRRAGDDLIEVFVGSRVKPTAVLFVDELAIARNRQQRRPQIMGDDRGELLEIAVAAGEFLDAEGHGLLQVRRITIDPFEARAVDVPQQLALIAQFLEVGEGAEIEGVFDRIVRGDSPYR